MIGNGILVILFSMFINLISLASLTSRSLYMSESLIFCKHQLEICLHAHLSLLHQLRKEAACVTIGTPRETTVAAHASALSTQEKGTWVETSLS